MPREPVTAPRLRRTPEQVKSQLLEAARDLFATKGYANTATREIADRAGVADNLLFRHFGSKAGLFEAAVADAFAQFAGSWAKAYSEHDETSAPEELGRAYVEGVYGLFKANRSLVIALLAVDEHEGHPTRGASPLDAMLRKFEDIVSVEMQARHLPGVDIPVMVRAVLGMVVSMVILDDWLWPPGTGKPPSKQRVVDELVGLIAHGVLHRPNARTRR